MPVVRPPTDIGGVTRESRQCVDVGVEALRALRATTGRVEVNDVVAPRSMALKDTRLGRRGNPESRGVGDVVLLDPEGHAHLIIRRRRVEEVRTGYAYIPTRHGQVEGAVASGTPAAAAVPAIARRSDEGAFAITHLIFRDRLRL